MQKDIFDRVLEEGYYIAHTGATVRKTAQVFHFSKSTVHKDVTERLSKVDVDLYKKVQKVVYYQSFAQKEVGQNIYLFKIVSISLFLALSRI